MKDAFRRDCLLIPDRFDQAILKSKKGAFPEVACRLIKDAEQALHAAPRSVLEKPIMPPSGDMRDYLSLSIYYWPDPASKDGLPYCYKDGQVNPESYQTDRGRFIDMVRDVESLSIAYAMTGDERFAAHAARLLHTWFLDEKTGMLPRMLFAQYIPGDEVAVLWPDYPPRLVPGIDGRKGVYVSFGGVIEDLHLVPLTDCIRLLGASPHWTAAHEAGIKKWYGDYTDWLLTHQHGLDEAACRNNHGSWYWADIACFLEFTGRQQEAKARIAAIFPERLDMQVEPDGSQPEELVRAISMNYTAFGLCSFTNMAVSGQRFGFDAWSVKGSAGRSLRRAVDWFVPYLTGTREWTWRQIRPFDELAVIGSLAACATRFPDGGYDDILRQLPFLPPDHRFRLLYNLD